MTDAMTGAPAGTTAGAPSGLTIRAGWLGKPAQAGLVKEVACIIAAAPLFRPRMPRSGRPFSVLMTNAGPLGWVADKTGYRYQATHPETGNPWAPIPGSLVALWFDLTGYKAPPECCLVNVYRGSGARMGLHRDADEAAADAPVLSLSLGDTAIFRIAAARRRVPACRLRLASGDALVLAGDARHAYHGIDRILSGSSSLIEGGGRFNLTLRRVSLPA